MGEVSKIAETGLDAVASLGLMLIDRAKEIVRANGIEPRGYRFGPLSIALQATGSTYLRRLTTAIEFARIQGTEQDAFRIIALDSCAPGIGRPPDWQLLNACSRQLVQEYESRDLQLVMHYDAVGRTWRVASLARRTAVLWTADATQLPEWEDSAPLRDILHWACLPTRQFLAHAAAIGWSGNGVLFAGPGGSGKSTTTVAAIVSGLKTAGDDFVLLDWTTRGIYALYDAVKLNEEAVQRLPQLPAGVSNPERPPAEKARLHVSQTSAFVPKLRLRAVLLPRIAQAAKTIVTPATQSDAMRALAPSTVLLLRGGRAETAAKAAAMIRSVPAYWMHLGSDPMEVAAVVSDLVQSYVQ
jgi:hypothetical protein